MSIKQREAAKKIAWIEAKLAAATSAEQVNGIRAWGERNKIGFDARALCDQWIAENQADVEAAQDARADLYQATS